MKRLQMFEFVEIKSHIEEYIVAESLDLAIEILNKTYKDDEQVCKFDSFNEVNVTDARKSIQFFAHKRPIRIGSYIRENNYPHFVGSSNPEFTLYEKKITSKRFLGLEKDAKILILSLYKDGEIKSIEGYVDSETVAKQKVNELNNTVAPGESFIYSYEFIEKLS